MTKTRKAGARITELWAWTTIDPDDDTEGVVGQLMPDGAWMPLVGADRARVESLEPLAASIARSAGLTITLKRFTTMSVVKEIKGAH